MSNNKNLMNNSKIDILFKSNYDYSHKIKNLFSSNDKSYISSSDFNISNDSEEYQSDNLNSDSLSFNKDKLKLTYFNYTYIEEIFSGCISLKSLHDISKWDISNINNICMVCFYLVVH